MKHLIALLLLTGCELKGLQSGQYKLISCTSLGCEVEYILNTKETCNELKDQLKETYTTSYSCEMIP